MAVRPLGSWQAHSAILYQNSAYPLLQSTGRRVIAFSDSASWQITDSGIMPAGYAGGSATFRLYWASWTTTAGNCRWQVEFERMANNGNATTSSTFVGTTAINAPPAATLAAMKYTDFTLTAANMANVVAGERFRFRLTRVGADGGDTMVGLAYYYGVYLQEI